MSTETRTSLDAWWDRECLRRKSAMQDPYPLPWDGASWACFVNFFAVVGMANAQIKVKYVSKEPVIDRVLEIWPKRQTWKDSNAVTSDD